MILSTINEKAKTKDEKISLIKNLQSIGFKSDCIDKTLNIVLEVYNKK
jgi:hypothetical protein